jgi:WD40-like Beta Propeller Repeat
MADLQERFHALTEVRPPDLWPNIEEREPRSPRGGRTARRALVAAVAFLVAAAGLAFAASTLREGSEPPQPADSTLTAPPVSFGGTIAYVVGRGADAEIRLVNLDGTGDRLLVSGRDPSWSPDRTQVAFRTGDSEVPGGLTTVILVLDVQSGAVQAILADPSGEASREAGPPVWSPDGSLIAFDTLSGIFVMRSDGIGGLRLVSSYDGDRACYDLEPTWAPDGARLAFSVRCDGGNEGIWAVNLDGSGRAQLAAPSEDTPELVEPAWSPDGSRIAFAGGDRMPGRTGGADVFVMEAGGSGLTRLTDGPRFEGRPAWSPDGTRIAFTDFSTNRIYVMNADGSDVERVPGIEGCCVAWQPTVGPDDAPAPESPDPATPVRAEVTATIPVGEFPTTVAAGAEGVWVIVMSEDGGCGSLARIDPSTNQVISTIALPVFPQDVAVGAGSAWVIGSMCPRDGPLDALLLRVSPATNAIEASIGLEGYLADVAADATGIWISRDINGSSGEVIRVDPGTEEVVDLIPVEGRLRDIELGAGSVWVLDTGVTTQSLVRIDASIGEVGGRVASPWKFAVGERDLWVADWLSNYRPEEPGAEDQPAAIRLDPGTLELVGEPIPLDSFTPVAVSRTGVWFVGGISAPHGLCHLDPDTGEVGPCLDAVGRLAPPLPWPWAFYPESQTIWVANEQDTVTRIALR